MSKGRLRLYFYAANIAHYSFAYKKLIKQIECDHVVATGSLVEIMYIYTNKVIIPS